MFLLNVDTSLDIMDAMINEETISHTEAKKLMIKQVKPSHRDLLLNTLTHDSKEFSFSSYDNNDDIHGTTRTKRVVGKMYKKSDVLLAIEEYKADNTLSNQFNEIIKQNELIKQQEIELLQQQELEGIMKLQIEARANEIMEQNNNEVLSSMDIDSNDIDALLSNFDKLMATMSYEEAYQQAKKELLGA